MAARLAAHTRVGRSHEHGVLDRLGVVPSDGTSTWRTQSGAWAGRCFSKKDWPSTPSGNRFMVSGRSAQVGEHHLGDAGVVVDQLALGEPGRG